MRVGEEGWEEPQPRVCALSSRPRVAPWTRGWCKHVNMSSMHVEDSVPHVLSLLSSGYLANGTQVVKHDPRVALGKHVSRRLKARLVLRHDTSEKAGRKIVRC